jgi:hypothetical protein
MRVRCAPGQKFLKLHLHTGYPSLPVASLTTGRQRIDELPKDIKDRVIGTTILSYHAFPARIHKMLVQLRGRVRSVGLERASEALLPGVPMHRLLWRCILVGLGRKIFLQIDVVADHARLLKWRIHRWVV